MAVKETPKDYSSMYSEDFGIASLGSIKQHHHSHSHNHNHVQHLNLNHINLKPPPIPPIPSSMMNSNPSNNIDHNHTNARNINTTSTNVRNNTSTMQLPTIASPRTSLLGKTQTQVTSTTTNANNNNSIQNKTMRTWDGSLSKRGQEPPVDLRLVVSKLEQFKKADHSADAMRTLNEHYSSVFKHGKSDQPSKQCNYRVCVKYHNEKDIYVIRTNYNTLKAVRNKLPIRGEFRYFFRDQDNQNVEIESDEAKLPTHYKDGQKNIYCQVFKI